MRKINEAIKDAKRTPVDGKRCFVALFTCSIQIIGFLAITTKENISFESSFAFAVGLYSYAPFGIKTTLQLLEIATSHVSFYSSLSENF